MLSQTATACVSNAVCVPMDADISPSVYNDGTVFRPLLQYNGDVSAAPFVFESGYLGQGSDGVLLEMNAAHASRVSTSHYLLYGNVTARLRLNATAGLVASFGTASDVGDAIAFAMGGKNASRVATNLAALGRSPSALGVDAKVPRFSLGNWHNYTIAWTPDRITWSIDQSTVRTVRRSDAPSYFPRTPSRVVFTLRGLTPGSSKRERQWAGGVLNMSDASFRERGYYAQELSHLQVKCADPALSNVSVTGVGSDPIAYYYTGQNSSASGGPAFQLSRDQIRLLPRPADSGKPGMPGWPGASPNGPRPNMYTGGTGRSDRARAPSPSGSNGVKIGVPLGIGLAALAGVLAILTYYFVRRRQRAKRRPPSFVDPLVPAPGTQPPDTYESAYPLAAYTSELPVSMPKEDSHDLSWSMDGAQAHGEPGKPFAWHENGYDDPDAHAAEVLSEDASLASEAPAHMHYAGHDTPRLYDARLTEAEHERLAAQDAWGERRIATPDDDPLPSDSSTLDMPFRARRGAHRAAYSEGGALGKSPTHTPTLSVHGATGWNPRARYE